ncbi:methyltransferase [Constantimarinum furrinae]|uniref:SAM-dependent methyltransferase n=1 Tax=Constantimarinum furrinae TaxID=2562285 RepID=A0A7G8PTW9_9FLAO|nr:methyltransferase [Constantimarinum furrinae]QNJ97785.1 SAM-dependent methyltransferase [Constantimarinum furrinae]
MIKKPKRAIDALQEAQTIAFAPFVFQTAVSLKRLGVFNYIFENREKGGVGIDEIASQLSISEYGIGVLLEMAESSGLVTQNEAYKYELTKTGYFLNYDKTVNVNLNFTHDVCYKGLFHLEDAIKTGTPSGLKELGDWKTIYDGLSQLPEQVQRSWFDFDHHYSDDIFTEALDKVLASKPKLLFDIGGNTGKFAICCCKRDPDIHIKIIDLPGQLNKALQNAKKHGMETRISGQEINWLDSDPQIPAGADTIWMSQFLDCFSEEEILKILRSCVASMDHNTELYITETFTDRQKFDNAKFVLEATSIYFTALANGNSKMYPSTVMIDLVEKAGLSLVEDVPLGEFHTILVCKKKD